jgi:hypothetical protein
VRERFWRFASSGQINHLHEVAKPSYPSRVELRLSPTNRANLLLGKVSVFSSLQEESLVTRREFPNIKSSNPWALEFALAVEQPIRQSSTFGSWRQCRCDSSDDRVKGPIGGNEHPTVPKDYLGAHLSRVAFRTNRVKEVTSREDPY